MSDLEARLPGLLFDYEELEAAAVEVQTAGALSFYEEQERILNDKISNFSYEVGLAEDNLNPQRTTTVFDEISWSNFDFVESARRQLQSGFSSNDF